MEDRGESQSTEIATVADAMAELDRREAARAEEAGEDADESQEEDSTSEADDSDDEPPEDESEAEDEDTPDETAEVEFDGKKLVIPKGTPPALVEAVKSLGNDLKADYTRKTQEVAQERQQVQQARQNVGQQIAQAQQAAQALAQLAQSVLGEEPSLELAQQDPQSYLVQQGLYRQRLQVYQGLQQQAQQAERQAAEMQAQQVAAQKAQEQAALFDKMPELKDSEKREAFAQTALKIAEKYSLPQAAVFSDTTNHNLFLMLRDLAEYHKLKEQTASAKTKLAAVPPPKVHKSTASAGQTEAKSVRTKEAKKQFMNSGRTMKDVERWIRNTTPR